MDKHMDEELRRQRMRSIRAMFGPAAGDKPEKDPASSEPDEKLITGQQKTNPVADVLQAIWDMRIRSTDRYFDLVVHRVNRQRAMIGLPEMDVAETAGLKMWRQKWD